VVDGFEDVDELSIEEPSSKEISQDLCPHLIAYVLRTRLCQVGLEEPDHQVFDSCAEVAFVIVSE